MTQLEKLRALAAYYCVHPLLYIEMLIDREYRRAIWSDSEEPDG